MRNGLRVQTRRVRSRTSRWRRSGSASTRTVEAAREDLRVNRERYSVGASTIVDVLTSQSSLVEAENTLIRARYDYQIARAQLEALLGRSL